MPPLPVSLKVLAESKTPGVTKATTFRVDPDLVIFEEGFNLRLGNKDLDADDERLFQAMKAGAFIPPIDVAIVEGIIICRDGHRRTKAAIRLKAEDLPEYTLEARQLRGNENDAVLHMLGTGNGGRPLSPLEQGLGYLRLINMGMQIPDIALKLGVSRVTIDKGLVLAEAPKELQNMVQRGEVSSTTAINAIKEGKEGVTALKEAVKSQREQPAISKKGKTKKVTARTLKGTGADKSTRKSKKAAEEKVETPQNHTTVFEYTDTSNVSITTSAESAAAVLKLINDFASSSCTLLNEFKAAIEMALL